MSGNLKETNQKQINSSLKQKGPNFCSPVLAKTQSAQIQQPNKIEMSKITESIVVLNNKNGYNLCPTCNQYKDNQDLKFLKD